jgi:hypothetical protein
MRTKRAKIVRYNQTGQRRVGRWRAAGGCLFVSKRVPYMPVLVKVPIVSTRLIMKGGSTMRRASAPRSCSARIGCVRGRVDALRRPRTARRCHACRSGAGEWPTGMDTEAVGRRGVGRLAPVRTHEMKPRSTTWWKLGSAPFSYHMTDHSSSTLRFVRQKSWPSRALEHPPRPSSMNRLDTFDDPLIRAHERIVRAGGA